MMIKKACAHNGREEQIPAPAEIDNSKIEIPAHRAYNYTYSTLSQFRLVFYPPAPLFHLKHYSEQSHPLSTA